MNNLTLAFFLTLKHFLLFVQALGLRLRVCVFCCPFLVSRASLPRPTADKQQTGAPKSQPLYWGGRGRETFEKC